MAGRSISRRRFLAGVGGTAFLALSGRRASAQAEVIAVLEVVQAVSAFLDSMQQRGNPMGASFLLLQSISRQLMDINLGLQAVLDEINRLKYFIEENGRLEAQQAYSREVLGGYEGFVEACKTRAGRLQKYDDPVAVDTDFRSEVTKAYDKVRDARREAQFLAENHFHRVALTLCMAWACEIEIALALAKSTAEIKVTNQAYAAWFTRTLDATSPQSLRSTSDSTTKAIPSKADALHSGSAFSEDNEKTLGFVGDCTADVSNGRVGATITFRSIVYRTTRSEPDGVISWSAPAGEIREGTMRTNGPNYMREWGYIPPKYTGCDGWDGSPPMLNLESLLKAGARSPAEKAADATATNYMAKSLSLTVKTCEKVMTMIEDMDKIADSDQKL